MTSKECLERLLKIAYVEPGPTKEKFITYAREIEHNKKCSDLYNIISQDLERLEKLEKENQELKERYKHRAEISNELNEALNQYEKALEILNDKFKFELGVSVVKEKYYYSLEFLYNNQYFTITQEEYELLKEVL